MTDRNSIAVLKMDWLAATGINNGFASRIVFVDHPLAEGKHPLDRLLHRCCPTPTDGVMVRLQQD